MAKSVNVEGVTRGNIFFIPPEAIQVDESENGRRFTADGHSLDDLVVSIVENGQLQPIIVRRTEDGQLQVVAGYRRLAAIKQINEAKLTENPLKIAADIRDCDDAEALEVNAVENLDRGNLSPIDRAYVMQRLKTLGREQKDIAKLFRVADSTVSLALSLLELPVKIQKKVHQSKLPVSLAYELAKMETDGEREKAVLRFESNGATATQARDEAQTTRVKKARAEKADKGEAEPGDETAADGAAKTRKKLKEVRLFVMEQAAEYPDEIDSPVANLYRFLAEWLDGGITDRTLKGRIARLLTSA